MKITNNHIEICRKLYKYEISEQQAIFLLVRSGLTESEAGIVIDTFGIHTNPTINTLKYISLSILCVMGLIFMTIFFMLVFVI